MKRLWSHTPVCAGRALVSPAQFPSFDNELFVHTLKSLALCSFANSDDDEVTDLEFSV